MPSGRTRTHFWPFFSDLAALIPTARMEPQEPPGGGEERREDEEGSEGKERRGERYGERERKRGSGERGRMKQINKSNSLNIQPSHMTSGHAPWPHPLVMQYSLTTQ